MTQIELLLALFHSPRGGDRQLALQMADDMRKAAKR